MTGKAARAPGILTGLTKKWLISYIILGSLGVCQLRAGRPVRGSYPQVINKLYVIREFGSLTRFAPGRGPQAVPHITRALGPRSSGKDARSMRHETI